MSTIDTINKSISALPIHLDMESSYTRYSGSVIIGRALPQLEDGLKPVHRRILYAMYEDGLDWNKPHVKCASVVGDVMKKYHPHGDAAIYDALVRLEQEFMMGAPLIHGQGNFGSVDDSSAAAPRYTEARLSKIAHYLMNDIEKNTVEFRDNYNAAYKEPVVLPASFPNLLINGSSGIAVGMATNIPPFNLGEIMDALIYMVGNKDATVTDILKMIKGPDFPTGGSMLGAKNIYEAMLTGRGSVVVRGQAEVETVGGKSRIIITEIPYQVNKARMIEKILELIKEKRIDGISDIYDESALDGIRVIIELRRDAQPEIVLNRLYKYTQLQESFGVNMMMIHKMRPMLMPVYEVLKAFLEFRIETVIKRIKFDLAKLRTKIHTLIGLAVATYEIDKAIAIIRGSSDVADARAKLLAERWKAFFLNEVSGVIERDLNIIDENGECSLTEEQVKAILELRLHRLTKLEKTKLIDEINQLAGDVQKCLTLLNDRVELEALIVSEFTTIKNEFTIPRRTRIINANLDEDIEDLIEREDMVVTVTDAGYVKRVPLDSYRTQSRGGKGKSGQTMSDEDSIAELFITNTHVNMLFFFSTGYVYKTKVHRLPQTEVNGRGRAITNIFSVNLDTKIKKIMPLPEDATTWGEYEIVFVTAFGNIRRNSLEDFRNIAANGKIAIRFDEAPEDEGDYLVDVKLCKAQDHIMIASFNGRAVRFPVDAVRVFKSRTSNGVRGIKLMHDDYVVSASILSNTMFDNTEKRDAYLKIDYDMRISGDVQLDQELSDLTAAHGMTKEDIENYGNAEELILTITENGFGKLTSAYDYRTTNRGASGITNIVTSKRNGGVAASFPAKLTDSVMLITNKGKIIRIPVSGIRISGRSTQGVTLFKLSGDEKICNVAKAVDQIVVEAAD